MRVELTPISKALRGSWKEVCQRCLERLRLCVYVEKDLVLPPMDTGAAVETFLVVASTDMERANIIMMDRIRDQVGGLPEVESQRYSEGVGRDDSFPASRRP